MPLNQSKIYSRTLKNQQKRAAKMGWAANDPRIERRAQRRAGQRMDFRKAIQSGDLARPQNRLQRNMAFRDFIGQKYDPQKMEQRYNRRMERRGGMGGGMGDGGEQSQMGGKGGGKGGYTKPMGTGRMGHRQDNASRFMGIR